MMKCLLVGLALAAVAALPAPATAQRLAAAASGVQGAVECLGRRDADSYGPLLRTAPYSSPERTEVQRLMPLMRRCLGHQDEALSVVVPQLRAAVVAYLYARDFAAPPAARTPPLAAAPLLQPALARNRSEVEPLAATYALFDCTTAAHPDLVRAYLATAEASPEEQTAFRALGAAVGPCLPPGASRQLALGGAALRGVLAEMLYRWSAVQRDGPASPFAAAAAPAAAH